LLEGDSVEADGQFSPDERWVAYSSDESGKNEVYAVPFHVPSHSIGPRRAAVYDKWRISISGGHRPRSRKDGRELFYIAADSTLMAVAVAGRGSQFEVGAALPLFHTNPSYVSSAFSYDVSADGNRFIVSTAAPEKIAPITLVENWLSDFKK